MYVVLDGKFVRARSAKVSVWDHGFLYGDGIYETLRTYNGKLFQVQEHLKRLEESAEAQLMPLPFLSAHIGKLAEQLVEKNKLKEARVRITVTRGTNDFTFRGADRPTLLISAVKLGETPEAIYKNGVKAVTVKGGRYSALVKSTSLLPLIVARQQVEKEKAFEGIFLDGQNVLEGTISNVFAVKRGVVTTPKKGILMGTTRDLVLKLFQQDGVKYKEQTLTVRALKSADEVFITSSVKGIVPVRKVDGATIGTGRPGPVTRLLMYSFKDYVSQL